MNARFSAAASLELREAIEFYEQQQPGLGLRFLNEVEKTVERIQDHPETWARMTSRLRRCLVHRFPFALFYHLDDTDIEILSVADLRRDPTSWEQLL